MEPETQEDVSTHQPQSEFPMHVPHDPSAVQLARAVEEVRAAIPVGLGVVTRALVETTEADPGWLSVVPPLLPS